LHDALWMTSENVGRDFNVTREQQDLYYLDRCHMENTNLGISKELELCSPYWRHRIRATLASSHRWTPNCLFVLPRELSRYMQTVENL
jgi:hypothetical protein